MAPEYIYMVAKDFKNFHSKALSNRGLLVWKYVYHLVTLERTVQMKDSRKFKFGSWLTYIRLWV
jgi:hypothetical protein